MTIQKPKTLQELRRLMGITLKDIQGVIAKQTFYNMIQGTHTPGEKTIEKLCKLFEIDNATFKKLLKNSIKN